MTSERHEFPGAFNNRLAARFEKPHGKMRATALFAHCFSCSKDILAAKRVSQRLAAAGIGVLRFDFTGLGHSEGEFENSNFTSNLDDLRAAIRYMEENLLPPSLLIGHSLGGAAVLQIAGEFSHVKAVATIGAPFHPEHVTHLFQNDLETISQKGIAQVDLGGRPFFIKKQFLDDLLAQSPSEPIANLEAALMVMHAPLDQQVGIENATSIFVAAKHPKSFVSLDGADHLLTKEKDSVFVASVISSWAARYIDLADEHKNTQYPEGVVRVSEADPAAFLQNVMVDGKFQLTADEPKSYGGHDQGPTPYQFVSTGLGACTSMTIRMYARRKGMKLDHVYVDVQHEKTHIETMETKDKVDKFLRNIYLEGDLSEAERLKLLEIANKCPVHRSLESGHILVETREIRS